MTHFVLTFLAGGVVIVEEDAVGADASPCAVPARGGIQRHAARPHGRAVAAAGVGERRCHQHHPAGTLALRRPRAAAQTGACKDGERETHTHDDAIVIAS